METKRVKSKSKSNSTIFLLGTLLILSIFVLSGCQNCHEKTVKYFEDVPIVTSSEEPVITTESKEEFYLDEDCKQIPNYELDFSDLIWLEGPVKGIANQAKRQVFFKNPSDDEAIFYFDKLYMNNANIVERTSPSFKQIVAPNSESKIFIVWNTEYETNKDVYIDLVNESKLPHNEVCSKVKKSKNIIEKVESTKVINNTHYETQIKYKTITVCD
ncbi:hypothetical protein HOK51_10220 [Candidatus Woesearchaeota archaeon]|jgi:hypothetical protein|nr:hypothetical protein [Candidatus Woesearchaeota archaeon]MBT6520200.1 hypothetical protein [Candidatus Woesearchaeota archaeon]MBT7367210.1 hypothetical protein [Candidatus Woesearchaeota archaeon]